MALPSLMQARLQQCGVLRRQCRAACTVGVSAVPAVHARLRCDICSGCCTYACACTAPPSGVNNGYSRSHCRILALHACYDRVLVVRALLCMSVWTCHPGPPWRGATGALVGRTHMMVAVISFIKPLGGSPAPGVCTIQTATRSATRAACQAAACCYVCYALQLHAGSPHYG
jgi:hypothetical protein